MSKEAEIKKLEKEILNLKKSPLYEYRKENNYVPVVGGGSLDAEIVFVGEAPGKNEAETGVPFCGRSGKILDEFLTSVGLPRDKIYITSIVNDRPPKNRDPKPLELDLYAPFLDRQLEIIKPKVIATLGRFSMKYLMERYGLGDKIDSISNLHGKIFKAVTPYGEIKLIPLFHPAVAIYNQKSKSDLLKDFKKLKQFIK